ncbi:MAG: hypothetical protein M3O34_05500 [Chloroflexota bacterium]|nr:hypothetical protein [Chloroflexota bacterium]
MPGAPRSYREEGVVESAPVGAPLDPRGGHGTPCNCTPIRPPPTRYVGVSPTPITRPPLVREWCERVAPRAVHARTVRSKVCYAPSTIGGIDPVRDRPPLYARLYGLTVGDRARLGDTNPLVEIEDDYVAVGDVTLQGFGKPAPSVRACPALGVARAVPCICGLAAAVACGPASRQETISRRRTRWTRPRSKSSAGTSSPTRGSVMGSSRSAARASS